MRFEPLTYRIYGVSLALRLASGLSRGATTARRTTAASSPSLPLPGCRSAYPGPSRPAASWRTFRRQRRGGFSSRSSARAPGCRRSRPHLRSWFTAPYYAATVSQSLRGTLRDQTARSQGLDQAVRFNPMPSNPAKIEQDGTTPLDSEQTRALLDAGKEDQREALYVLSHRRVADRRTARVEVERYRPLHWDALRQPSATMVHR